MADEPTMHDLKMTVDGEERDIKLELQGYSEVLAIQGVDRGTTWQLVEYLKTYNSITPPLCATLVRLLSGAEVRVLEPPKRPRRGSRLPKGVRARHTAPPMLGLASKSDWNRRIEFWAGLLKKRDQVAEAMLQRGIKYLSHQKDPRLRQLVVKHVNLDDGRSRRRAANLIVTAESRLSPERIRLVRGHK